MTLVLLAGLLTSCGDPTDPCGDFTFAGAPHSDRGIDMSLTFRFAPEDCGAPASTGETVAYIQIVRIIDQDTGAFLAPNSEQQNRIVTGRSSTPLNGWAVDRLSGRVWGYYGRNNDGTFAGTLTPGNDTTDAVLRDTPSGWPNRSWFDAVSVPVCIQGSACLDRLAGYYYWLFIVGSDGTVGDPFDQIGVDWNRDAVDESVDEWNNDAPGLGKNSFPALSRLP